MGSVPGLGRSPGERNGYPLQYSCLKNPMDRGAWWATVHGVSIVGHNWATGLTLKWIQEEIQESQTSRLCLSGQRCGLCKMIRHCTFLIKLKMSNRYCYWLSIIYQILGWLFPCRCAFSLHESPVFGVPVPVYKCFFSPITTKSGTPCSSVEFRWGKRTFYPCVFCD